MTDVVARAGQEGTMTEELGIIHDAHFGMRDFHQPGLWFEVETIRGSSLQCFWGQEALDIIQKYSVYDVKDLEGKSCKIARDGSLMRWMGKP